MEKNIVKVNEKNMKQVTKYYFLGSIANRKESIKDKNNERLERNRNFFIRLSYRF